MSHVLNLKKSLRLRGRGEASLQRALFLCARDLFGLTREEFARHWRPRADADTGTLRGYMQPSADALFAGWKERRDPAWLYTHPDYKWDSIGVSVCQTHATVASGIKLLMDRGIRPQRAFDWGAGPGFSSIMLARNFPGCEVHYSEVNADLIAVFDWFRSHAGISNIRHVPAPEGGYDLVQAYEIAEHIAHADRSMFEAGIGDPVTETVGVLGHTTPGAHFLHSSCWSAEERYTTLGHFLSYDVDGTVVKNTRTNGAFKGAMSRRGWHVLGHGWNSRPTLYGRV